MLRWKTRYLPFLVSLALIAAAFINGADFFYLHW